MATPITSDADMPKCLNTPSKQAKKARQLAETYSGLSTKKARGPRLQGFFSRTMIVTLQGNKEVVIQFRPEPLDLEPFQVARRALGPFVPEVEVLYDEELKQNGIWPYLMTRIPGTTWLDGTRGKDPKTRVTINKTLARILSRGHLVENSEEVVNSKLRHHLELLLSSEDDQIRRFHDVAKELLGKLDELKQLPLFVSHFDLNEVNVMVDEICEVSGIVDWELSTPLPFGVGFGRIHILAGEFSEQKFYMPPEFDDAERGFWKEIYDGVSAQVRDVLDSKPDVVQVAVTLGTLLDTFTLDEGKIWTV
ncbi:MAG: hypothetical protein M1837_005430 [Sclerophora amabilis]|nr:MAG: hypothetical protein M1837_005430 [Sclerophora amabilis]